MAYSAKARKLRRCTARRKDGKRCRAWAAWDDSEQRCNVHAGRHFRGHWWETDWGRAIRAGDIETAMELDTHHLHSRARCDCAAYPHPHRPGGGACRWPDEPKL